MSSPSKLSNLQQRLIAAFIGGALIIFCVVFDYLTFTILFSLIALLSLWEFYALLRQSGHRPNRVLGFLQAMILVLLLYQLTTIQTPDRIMIYTCVVFLILLSLTLVAKLFDAKDHKPFESVALTILGPLYVVLPFVLYMSLSQNYQLPLGLLFLLWASDSGAYFAGKKWGKTKLFERISPKKTWEGSVGGLVCSLIIALVLSYYFDNIDLWRWIAYAVIIVVAGTLGDLVESMLKRSLKIKDSGSIIPGHGGFLDRFDGLLVASPFIWTIDFVF